MDFRITGLAADAFRHLYGRSDEALRALGVTRYVVDACPGFPDRIEMRDAQVGERVLLLNHVCQPAATAYRASHAIFVREGAERTYDRVNEVPPVMRPRLLSLRAYDAHGMMVDADVTDGHAAEAVIRRLLGVAGVEYLHVHNAKRGCYAGRVTRA